MRVGRWCNIEVIGWVRGRLVGCTSVMTIMYVGDVHNIRWTTFYVELLGIIQHTTNNVALAQNRQNRQEILKETP